MEGTFPKLDPESSISFLWSDNYYVINLEMLKITPIRLGSVSLGLYLHNNYFIRKTHAPQNEK